MSSKFYINTLNIINTITADEILNMLDDLEGSESPDECDLYEFLASLLTDKTE